MAKNLKKKVLPISCLCSIYIGTNFKELKLGILSLFIGKNIPDQVVLIRDGNVSQDIDNYLNFLKNKSSNIFTIVELEKNIGLGLALAKGLNFCRNEFVMRFDSDDINLKDRVSKMYNVIKKGEIDILGSSVYEFRVINNHYFSRIKFVPSNELDLKNNFLFRNPINHPTVIFKKSKILKVGSYRYMPFFEDYDLWIRCFKHNFKITNISEPLVAMKRISLLERRNGFRYFYHELSFVFKMFNSKNLNFFHFLILFSRAFLRICPNLIIKIFISIKSPWRTKLKKDKTLSNYIKKLTELTLLNKKIDFYNMKI